MNPQDLVELSACDLERVVAGKDVVSMARVTLTNWNTTALTTTAAVNNINRRVDQLAKEIGLPD
jgi:hypothetical protein